MNKKRGQVSVFVIVAILVIGGIAAFFMLKDRFVSKALLPASLEPPYKSFLSCLEDAAEIGTDVLSFQAGYIELPEFEPGSDFMPFSSQLDFMGTPVPYWYYVSGNNIQKEQIPSKTEMEDQLNSFIEDKIKSCRFDNYYEEGFKITLGNPKAKTSIKEDAVEVNLGMKMEIEKGDEKAIINNHKITIKSKLGKLYDAAKKIYNYEQKTLFLENYSVDILRLYAPVDGVELSCSPKVWIADNVFDTLQDAIESNIMALKVKTGDYSLRSKENRYFVVDLSLDRDIDVRFINSKNWPNSFEVAPTESAENNILIAKPVGNQPGLGIMGFCYAPYHFVYNIKYPVLVQLSSGDEMFQFPVAVVIQGNKPRKPLEGAESLSLQATELCKYRNTFIEVNTYDTRLNPVEAKISYECLGVKCDIGKTSKTKPLKGLFPECVNGYIITEAEGFEDAKYLFSTNKEGSADIILDKLYKLKINLNLDGRPYSGDNAIIHFIPIDKPSKGGKSIVYPMQKTIELSEGEYEIRAYIYRNSSLRIPSSSIQQCVDVPASGIGGILGITKKECFDVEIPEQIVSNALAGGGVERYYVLESELENSGTIEINAYSLPLPNSLEKLQENYILFEEQDLDIIFKNAEE